MRRGKPRTQRTNRLAKTRGRRQTEGGGMEDFLWDLGGLAIFANGAIPITIHI